MTTRDTILRVLAEIRAEHGLEPVPADDATAVGEQGLGLDSLDMATAVAVLEDELGVDPFARGEGGFHTVGELVSLYEKALHEKALDEKEVAG